MYEDVVSNQLYGIRRQKPVVSIMIPTYLRNDYLKETIDSAISQDTDEDYEIVVVDNNPDIRDTSTLNLINMYDQKRVSYYKNTENLGMFGNWNRCLELANGSWVLILHDDDTIKKDYISNMLKITRKFPDTSCVGCSNTLIDGNNNLILQKPKGFKWRVAECLLNRESYEIKVEDFFYTHPINIMGLFINKGKAIEIGGFDNRWDPTSDYIFILNLAERFMVRCTDKALLNYRQSVNASLSPKHLIGMVEVDAFMRIAINKHLNLMNQEKEYEYRRMTALVQEKYLEKNWFSRLDSQQRQQVLDEYEKFNNYMNFKADSFNYKSIIIKMQGLYSFKIKYLRR